MIDGHHLHGPLLAHADGFHLQSFYGALLLTANQLIAICWLPVDARAVVFYTVMHEKEAETASIGWAFRWSGLCCFGISPAQSGV